MQQAGFRYVFLGIENVLDEDLAFLKARREEQPARAGPPDRQRDDSTRSTSCTATACSSSAG